MKRFAACLAAELIKLRRTSIWLILITTPYVIVLFFFLLGYFDGERFLRPGYAWTWLTESSFSLFTVAVLPLWVAIVTAQAAAIEQRSAGWRRLGVLPVPRFEIYAAKQVLAWLMTGAVYAGLAVAILVAGGVLRLLRPGLGFEDMPPVVDLTLLAISATVASLFIVAIQTWLALIRDDLGIPIAVGVLATLGLLALSSLDASTAGYHPWSYPSRLLNAWSEGNFEAGWCLAGAVGGIIFALAAGLGFARRDVW